MCTFLRTKLLSFLVCTAITSPEISAWTASPFTKRTKPSIIRLNEGDIPEPPISNALPRDETIWKTEGERIILGKIVECGGNPEDVDIEWKPGQIVITLSGDSFIQAKVDEEDEDFSALEYDEEIDEKAVQEFVADFVGEESENEDEEEEEEKFGTDVVSIARAINFALGEEGEGSMAYNIAVHHSIEVTTPGASDELEGIMFESYKGFDVIVEAIDKKKDKKTEVEGKLVERNEKQTIINVKGRLRKLKNELVMSVRLPKAKKEKGVK
jgi:hypothetical protein